MSAERLRKLFPEISDDDLDRAVENLDSYVALAWEIYEENCLNTYTLTPHRRRTYDECKGRFLYKRSPKL